MEKPGQADGGGIAAGDGLVAATGYGKLWAINAQNGAVQWSQVLSSGNSQPAYKDGLIYLVSNDLRHGLLRPKLDVFDGSRWDC